MDLNYWSADAKLHVMRLLCLQRICHGLGRLETMFLIEMLDMLALIFEFQSCLNQGLPWMNIMRRRPYQIELQSISCGVRRSKIPGHASDSRTSEVDAISSLPGVFFTRRN